MFLHLRIERMNIVLKGKEEATRKLKETLRKLQQHGDDSCKLMIK